MTNDGTPAVSAPATPAIETWTQDPSGADRFTCPSHPGVALSLSEVVDAHASTGVRRDVIVTDLVVRFRR
jgi:hypothetical protein